MEVNIGVYKGNYERGINMERRKELLNQYKEIKPEAGVFGIKNLKNNKIYISSTRNLKTLNGQRFTLETSSHKCMALQKEWTEFGSDNFVFEVLEILKVEENEYFNIHEALKKLEAKWLLDLKPYGERGYNKEKVKSS